MIGELDPCTILMERIICINILGSGILLLRGIQIQFGHSILHTYTHLNKIEKVHFKMQYLQHEFILSTK